MPNIKIGGKTVSIPNNINSKDSLDKIIQRLKIAEIEQPTSKPVKKADGGMMKKNKKGSDAEALEGIEKQQKSQAKRAEQAHKDVREYVRKKARTKKANGGMVRGTGSAIRGKGFKGVF